MKSIVESARGLVQLGAFTEVLNIPGKYLNDHCFIHGHGQWHFFGIVGPVGKGCHSPGSEVSFAHATSEDLVAWKVHKDEYPRLVHGGTHKT